MLYDLVSWLLRPLGWWARLRVEGLEHVPAEGPVLFVPNHDSQMDPVLIGLAIRPRRDLRYLAMAELWKIPLLGPILDGMRQIPIRRGTGDTKALDRAVEALKAGDVVTIFPEGRCSWGERVRARSGVGLLAGWAPEAVVVLCTIEGSTDFVRFPKRPRVTVRCFRPGGGSKRPDEAPAGFASRLLGELRSRVPPTPAGRKRIIGGPPRIRRSLARNKALAFQAPAGSDASTHSTPSSPAGHSSHSIASAPSTPPPDTTDEGLQESDGVKN